MSGIILSLREKMAKKYHVHLTAEERSSLFQIIKKRKEDSPIVIRSQTLLAADENGTKCWSDSKIFEAYGYSIRSIERLRERFVEDGLDVALHGKKRGPKQVLKKLDGRAEAKLIALRCSKAPEGSNGWTLRLLADKMVELNYVDSLSHECVRQVLKKQNEALAGKILDYQ